MYLNFKNNISHIINKNDARLLVKKLRKQFSEIAFITENYIYIYTYTYRHMYTYTHTQRHMLIHTHIYNHSFFLK